MIRSGEIEKMLASDAWDKKRSGHGRYRSRGKMRTPVDYLTGEEKKKYQEKVQVNYSKIKTFQQYESLTDEQQLKCLKKWMKRYTLDEIYAFEGWNPVLFFKRIQAHGLQLGDFAQRGIKAMPQIQEQQAQGNTTQEAQKHQEIMDLTWTQFRSLSDKERHEFIKAERMKFGNVRMNVHWGKKVVSYYLHQNYTAKKKEMPPINNQYVLETRNKNRAEKSKQRREKLKDDLSNLQEKNFYLELKKYPEKADTLYNELTYDLRAKLLNEWFNKYGRAELLKLTGWSSTSLSRKIAQLKAKGFTIFQVRGLSKANEEQKEITLKEKETVMEQQNKNESENEQIPIKDWIQEEPETPQQPNHAIMKDGFSATYQKSSVDAKEAAKRLRMMAALIEESEGTYSIDIGIQELESKEKELLALQEPVQPEIEPEEEAADITEQDLQLLKLIKGLRS